MFLLPLQAESSTLNNQPQAAQALNQINNRSSNHHVKGNTSTIRNTLILHCSKSPHKQTNKKKHLNTIRSPVMTFRHLQKRWCSPMYTAIISIKNRYHIISGTHSRIQTPQGNQQSSERVCLHGASFLHMYLILLYSDWVLHGMINLQHCNL